MIAGNIKNLLRPWYHRMFRLHLRTRLWLADCSRSTVETSPPLPPALLRYRVSESLAGDNFLTVGRACANHIETQLRTMGATLTNGARVLDFGCGCGRTLRWLTNDFPETMFYGVDVDADAIHWCENNLPSARFGLSTPKPPLSFPDAHFDVVYCFSVFTHLDEPLQDAWLLELKRVLKSDGILIITVHNQRAANALDKPSSKLLLRDGFVHMRSRKLKGIVPEWYNTTWHSRAHIVERLERLFTDLRYTVVSDGMQDLVAARVRR